LLGDSIRLGYDKYVKMAFEGIAQIYYPKENCRFAAYICRNLHEWKRELQCSDDVDLVHWNAGLWDDLILLDGKHLTPIEVYAMYIERICQMIKAQFPMAKMVFATSTPVQEELFTTCLRYNRDTEAYNRAAIQIVERYGGQINDLYTAAIQAPVEFHSDLTHYYTKEGTRLLADQVIRSIEEVLDIQAKALDYDALFDAAGHALGV